MKHLVSLASLLTALYSSLLFAAEAPKRLNQKLQQPFKDPLK